MTVDWDWLAEVYRGGGWRIAAVRASGTAWRQELVLTLERRMPADLDELWLGADQSEWDGFDAALSEWRSHDVDRRREDGCSCI